MLQTNEEKFFWRAALRQAAALFGIAALFGNFIVQKRGPVQKPESRLFFVGAVSECMSTNIVYSGRARVVNGTLFLEVAAAASNVRPLPIRSFGKSDGDFYVWGKFPVGDEEAIACAVESFARDYDGRCINERYREYDGVAAYRLWAYRIRQAAGIRLRSPRLSKVFWDGVPPNITGRAPHGGPHVRDGEKFGYDVACELVRAGVSLPVEMVDSGVVKSWGRLGFFTKGGALCYFTPHSKHRGFTAGVDRIFTALEDSRGSTWGDFVEIDDGRGQDLHGLCAGRRLFLFGKHEGHRIADVMEGKPTLFSRSEGWRLLERLCVLMPECCWMLVPVDVAKRMGKGKW